MKYPRLVSSTCPAFTAQIKKNQLIAIARPLAAQKSAVRRERRMARTSGQRRCQLRSKTMKRHVQTKRCARISIAGTKAQQLPIDGHEPPGDKRGDTRHERGPVLRRRRALHRSLFHESAAAATSANCAVSFGAADSTVETAVIALSEKLLSGAGGWQAMKAARELFKAGRVESATYEPPLAQRDGARRKNLSRRAPHPQRHRCGKHLHLSRFASGRKDLRPLPRRRSRLARSAAGPACSETRRCAEKLSFG